MKKQITLITLTLIAILISVSASSAADINVGPGQTYTDIKNAVNDANDNDTIIVANGIYTGENNTGIAILKNLTITGQSKTGTIINAQGNNLIFDVGSDYTLILKDLTLKNGDPKGGGAIYNQGSLTLNNCDFINNTADDGGAIYNDEGSLTLNNCKFIDNTAGNGGGAIYNYKGTCTVNSCTFTNNHLINGIMGGAIYNIGTMSIINSIFDGNYAHDGLGGAILNTYGGLLSVEKSTFKNNYAHSNMGAGGAILNWGTATITDSIFKNNAAYLGGAIFNQGGSLKVTGSTIDGNEAVSKNGQRLGGGIYLSYGSFEIIGNHIINNIGSGIYIANFATTVSISVPNGIHKALINFNRIYGNTPYGIEIPDIALGSTTNPVNSILNATLNWWGKNSGPNSAGADKTNLESTYYTPWIVMGFSPTQVLLNGGETTLLTANFLYDNLGGYHDPQFGHIPDGTPVLFTTTLGQVGSQQIVKYTVNGVATAILKAWDEYGNPVSGIAYLTATTDGQTLSSSVTITPVANAATVGMQKTGLPIAGLILAIIAVFGGLVTCKRK